MAGRRAPGRGPRQRAARERFATLLASLVVVSAGLIGGSVATASVVGSDPWTLAQGAIDDAAASGRQAGPLAQPLQAPDAAVRVAGCNAPVTPPPSRSFQPVTQPPVTKPPQPPPPSFQPPASSFDFQPVQVDGPPVVIFLPPPSNSQPPQINRVAPRLVLAMARVAAGPVPSDLAIGAPDLAAIAQGAVSPAAGDPRSGPLTAPVVGDAPGLTRRVPVSTNTAEGNGPSGGPPPQTERYGYAMTHGGQAISADALWVAFVSAADNLVDDDTNRTTDLFLRDRVRGTTIRIPWIDGRQLPARCAAAEPSISADGQVVAFTVYPVATPTRPVGVFVYDVATGQTEVGSQDDGVIFAATQPSISSDGRYLAFAQLYSYLKQEQTQVFVRDRQAGNTQMVSLVGGRPANGYSRAPSISRGGRFVALESDANLDGNDSNQLSDIYLLDRATGGFTRLTFGPGGQQGDGESTDPSISDDGSVVAFASWARNLIGDQRLPELHRVFAWERDRNAVRLASLDQSGSHAADASFSPSLSADGNYVAFQSAPPDTSSGCDCATPALLATGGPGDVFLRDLRRNITTRISIDTAGREVPGDSGRPSVSGDGLATAFDSTDSGLIPDDTNQVRDVFVRDLVPAAIVTPDKLTFGRQLLGKLAGPLPVTVLSIGWAPLDVKSVDITGDNAPDFRVVANSCAGVRLPLGDTCQIRVTFRTTKPGQRSALLQVFDTSLTGPHPVPLLGVAGELMLKVDPPIGPPGFVTVVSGSGFAPGGGVALRWDRGITAKMAPVIVDEKGDFSVGMLVFHHDIVGPRNLVATDIGGGDFPETSVPFLVVTPTAQPPALGPFRYLPADAKPLVDRH